MGRPDPSGRPVPVPHVAVPPVPAAPVPVTPPVVAAIGAQFAAGGWQVHEAAWPDRRVVVARQSKLMWQAAVSRVHTAVVVVPLHGTEDRAWLDGLQTHVVDFAMTTHGGALPRGMQSGSAVVTVAVGAHLPADVRAWAEKTHGRRFAVMTHPVLVDTATRDVVHPGPAIMGFAFNGHFRRIVDRFVRPAVGA